MTASPYDAADAPAAWAARSAEATIPVCSETALAIETARRNEDRIDANRLGEIIAVDPLMTLRLMAHAASLRGPRQLGDPQTVTAAIVWMGIGPFFRAFANLETIEQRLDDEPAALAHVMSAIEQKRLAARLAFGIAAQRADPEAPLLHQAALLDGYAALLLWVHEPELALKLDAAAQGRDKEGSSAVEREILGVELADLQRALNRNWRLPAMLERAASPRHAEEPGVRSVRIALRIARHHLAQLGDASAGSSSGPVPARPEPLSRQLANDDDLADLADLLDLKREAVAAVLDKILG